MPKKPKDIYIPVCPKCKSTNVHPDYSNVLVPAMGLPATYICENCKNQGYVFPEVKRSELADFQKGVLKIQEPEILDEVEEKEPDITLNYGRFVVNIVWKLTGPISFIAGLLMLRDNLLWAILYILTGALLSYAAYRKKK
jgi:hypothetical protein